MTKRQATSLSSNAPSDMKASPGPPILTFAMVADVQYADVPDGAGFSGNPRYYRQSLQTLRNAIDEFNSVVRGEGPFKEFCKGERDTSGGREGVRTRKQRKVESNVNDESIDGWKPTFLMNLGDTVDGKCKMDTPKEMKKVVSEMDKFTGGRVYHVFGNHDMYWCKRQNLYPILNISPFEEFGELVEEGGKSKERHPPPGYWSESPYPGVRCLFLDTYDIGTLGWEDHHPNTIAANAILNKHNPNKDKNDSAGLQGLDKRFVGFNGGLSDGQLAWMRQTLEGCRQDGEVALLFGHVPLYPRHNSNVFVWNYEEVQEIIHEYAPDVLIASICGHDHPGGITRDPSGLLHYSLSATLETKPGNSSHAYVHLFPDRLEIRGIGRAQSAKTLFPKTMKLVRRRIS